MCFDLIEELQSLTRLLVFPCYLSNLSCFLPEVNKRLWSELTKEAGLIDLLLLLALPSTVTSLPLPPSVFPWQPGVCKSGMKTSNTWWAHIVAHKRPVTYMWSEDGGFSQKNRPSRALEGGTETQWQLRFYTIPTWNEVDSSSMWTCGKYTAS